ncbi:MAG: hypothetical protein AABX71_02595 [Nanoarchaeota archaeon]
MKSFISANQIAKTIALERKYQNTRWVKLNMEKDCRNKIENRKILAIFMRRKQEREKKIAGSLFFKGIGVVKFKIRRR